MITEAILIGLTTYGYRKIKSSFSHSGEKELMNRWMASMIGAGIKNKDQTEATFELVSVKKTDYGFNCDVSIPFGISIDKLQGLKPVIETNLSCICEIEKDNFSPYATVKIIKKILDFDYEPVKTKENELFLGYKLDGSKYILDLNVDNHILIAGMTGSGKSFLLALLLANHIYYHSKDVDIYLFQNMKSEIDIFKNCPGIKFTSNCENEILVMLKRLVYLINKRSNKFTENGLKNITQWNKHFQDKKMKRIIVGVEEISFFMNEASKCFEFFTQIVKAGRSVGIHLVCLTQRTTSANLGGNGELKSQVTLITAKQRSELDSRNAIDIGDAAFLGRQEFIASANNGYVRFKVPNIDEDFKILNKYVPEIIIPKEDTESETIKEKTVLHMSWHRPTAEEWNQIKDTIPEVTYVKQEVKIPTGQMGAPKKNSKRKGVMKISEVLKDAK